MLRRGGGLPHARAADVTSRLKFSNWLIQANINRRSRPFGKKPVALVLAQGPRGRRFPPAGLRPKRQRCMREKAQRQVRFAIGAFFYLSSHPSLYADRLAKSEAQQLFGGCAIESHNIPKGRDVVFVRSHYGGDIARAALRNFRFRSLPDGAGHKNEDAHAISLRACGRWRVLRSMRRNKPLLSGVRRQASQQKGRSNVRTPRCIHAIYTRSFLRRGLRAASGSTKPVKPGRGSKRDPSSAANSTKDSIAGFH